MCLKLSYGKLHCQQRDGVCWNSNKEVEKSETNLLIKGLKKQAKKFKIRGFGKSGDQEGKVKKEESELIRERLMKAGTQLGSSVINFQSTKSGRQNAEDAKYLKDIPT